jgi:lipopolysaccharide/colanic/teichoic acid biosynthesis glycosyltransferase
MIENGTSASVATFRPSITPATIRFLAQEAMRPQERTGRERAVRALNVVVAALAILLVAPLMLLVAIAIRATSRGPAIYKQPRVGVDRRKSRGPEALNHRRRADVGGRVFTIYKFGTMRPADDAPQQVWASQDDPRITPVGRVLRAFRLDELPQLFNVLKGDMNIVGPRPEQPAIFANLSEELSHYRRRQKVLPGITGLAQITLPYDQDLNDVRNKVDLDLEYIRQRSVGQDLLIMAKTMPVMVMRKGWM